jgi:hypothetical protein
MKREHFHRAIPSAEGKAVHYIDGIRISYAGINVPTWKELGFRGGWKKHQAQQCQNHGNGFRHENGSSMAIMPAANST